MDILNPLFLLLFRSLIVFLPLIIAWLAFRRLMASTSGNAWIYAITCLFAAMTAAGLMPWALGLMQASWVFFVFSAFCPAIWIGVVTVCDMSRRALYEPDPVADTVLKFKSSQAPTPLVRENPDRPGTPMPVFRHRAPKASGMSTIKRVEKTVTKATKSLLSVARDMRGSTSSEPRRQKLLPSPETKQITYIES